MNNIAVTKTGSILSVIYNGESSRFSEYARNMDTGQHLSLLNNDSGIETNILCNEEMQYNKNMFNTVGGVVISTNQILFDELKKML